MLISHHARCIFVHVQKTGGSSVEAILRAHIPDLHRIGYKHDPAAWHRPSVPEWDGYFKFAFVRNPWDRLVSWHSMIMSRHDRRGRWSGKTTKPSMRLWDYAVRHGRRFEDFVRYCTDEIEDPHYGRKSFAWNQIEYLRSPSGELLVDYVGRFERFELDLRAILQRLNLNHAALAHTNASRHAHYSDYYSPFLAALVARRFGHDIAAFDYRFDALRRATR